MKTPLFNPTQKHLLQMFNYFSSEEQLEEVKAVLLRFYSSKLQDQIDKYWSDNNLDESTVDAILAEHMRTPYSHSK